MRKDLLGWQWKLYRDNHTRRVTLVIHLVSAPLFIVGLLLLAGAALIWELGVVGLAFMVSAVASQGWAHKMEPNKPVPFDGPLDFIARFVAEQIITFPRFLMSGELGRAWRRDG
jgi:2-hydroxy-palmitic acid dioxygenase Mpo1-like protein